MAKICVYKRNDGKHRTVCQECVLQGYRHFFIK